MTQFGPQCTQLNLDARSHYVSNKLLSDAFINVVVQCPVEKGFVRIISVCLLMINPNHPNVQIAKTVRKISA